MLCSFDTLYRYQLFNFRIVPEIKNLFTAGIFRNIEKKLIIFLGYRPYTKTQHQRKYMIKEGNSGIRRQIMLSPLWFADLSLLPRQRLPGDDAVDGVWLGKGQDSPQGTLWHLQLALILLRGTWAFQSSIAALFSSFLKGFHESFLTTPILLAGFEGAKYLLYVTCRQMKNFRLPTVNFISSCNLPCPVDSRCEQGSIYYRDEVIICSDQSHSPAETVVQTDINQMHKQKSQQCRMGLVMSSTTW